MISIYITPFLTGTKRAATVGGNECPFHSQTLHQLTYCTMAGEWLALLPYRSPSLLCREPGIHGALENFKGVSLVLFVVTDEKPMDKSQPGLAILNNNSIM